MTQRARRGGRPHRSRPSLRGLVILACALLAGSGSGCSPPGAAGGGGGEAQVEADVFSGRPNPRWTLDAARTEELARRVRELPAAAGPAAAPYEGLGYRGLVATGLPGECAEVRVRRGQVRAVCGGEARALADPGGALERWLAATAEGRAEPAVVELLRRETGGAATP